MAEGTTIGVYYAEHEENELEGFDRAAARHQDRRRYSRSKAVRTSMDMYKMILDTIEDTEWDGMDDRALRASVRQAILEQIRRESE